MRRAQEALIKKDLAKKMVFLTGPRQVGKTHLALEIAKTFKDSIYLNYDSPADREVIRKNAWLPTTELLVLDELHKMQDWKNFLKGVYDTKPENLKILVTGSARLEVFRSSGDSLAGRFFRHRLSPLTLAELSEPDDAAIDLLMTRGGFPEPFLAQHEQDAQRWRMQYIDGLIRTDILDFERVHDLRAMQMTFELLRHRVGSPLSYTSMANDIQCAPNTIRRYIEILEALFIIFRVTPFHRNIARSLLKEPKVYFYDTGLVQGEEGIRFENMVAVSLMKHVNAIEDYDGKMAALQYIRTKEKKEVDFALAIENKPVQLIEVKWADSTVAPSLKYFSNKYKLPATQVVRHLRQEQMDGTIAMRRAYDFLKELRL